VKDVTAVDTRALSSSVAASSNHSDDASVMILSIIECKKYHVSVVPIHDAMGTSVEFSAITKIVFKKNNIKFIESNLKNEGFPMNLIREMEDSDDETKKNKQKLLEMVDANKKLFENNIEEIKKEIMESDDLFN